MMPKKKRKDEIYFNKFNPQALLLGERFLPKISKHMRYCTQNVCLQFNGLLFFIKNKKCIFWKCLPHKNTKLR